MFSTIVSGAILGIRSYLVHVEVDMSQGLPCFVMVGSLGSEVRESGERVRIALKNSGIYLPPMHIAVNLSPADIKKEGTGFDLPIAAAMLVSMGYISKEEISKTLILGELGLNGEIKPVKGVLPIVKEAKEQGIRFCIVPLANVGEALAITNIKTAGAESLKQLIEYFGAEKGSRKEEMWQTRQTEKEEDKTKQSRLDFSEVAGQESVKRAALIAAAGFHNLLLSGPPGSGKTMIAKRISSILPPLTQEERLEVSAVYSISGKLDSSRGLIAERPFLNPHHTITEQAMTGGGRMPKPGVISLAHRGVLLLDEMPEFKRSTLDALRQPLEDKVVQIARSCGAFYYPADFMMIGTMNPCPCGYYPDINRCTCTPAEIHRYVSHISGPILDRIDIQAAAPKVEISQLQARKSTAAKACTSSKMREQVMMARERQQQRYQGTCYRLNAGLGAEGIEHYCRIGNKELKMLETVFSAMEISARAYHRILKVARTIADLEGSSRIKEEHLAEAVCYRMGGNLYGTN